MISADRTTMCTQSTLVEEIAMLDFCLQKINIENKRTLKRLLGPESTNKNPKPMIIRCKHWQHAGDDVKCRHEKIVMLRRAVYFCQKAFGERLRWTRGPISQMFWTKKTIVWISQRWFSCRWNESQTHKPDARVVIKGIARAWYKTCWRRVLWCRSPPNRSNFNPKQMCPRSLSSRV